MNVNTFYQLQENEFMVSVSYPYKAHDMRQLSLKQHEKIKVIQVHESGWWIGENISGDVGLFPSNYVSRISGDGGDLQLVKKFNKPKEFRPELAQVDFELKKSRTKSMIDSLGLAEDDLGDLAQLDNLDALLSDSDESEDEPNISALNISANLTDEVERYKSEIEKIRSERDEVKREKEMLTHNKNAEMKVASLADKMKELESAKPALKSSKSSPVLRLEDRQPLSARGTRPSEIGSQRKIDDLSKQLQEYKNQLETMTTENEKNKRKVELITEKYNKDMKTAVEKIQKHKLAAADGPKTTPINASLSEKMIKCKKNIGYLRATQKVLKQDALTSIDVIRNQMNQLSKNGIDQLGKMVDEITTKYKREYKMRRDLFNQLQELKGNIRVYVRVRPVLSSDGPTVPSVSCDLSEVSVSDPTTKKTHKFEFERAFGPESTQAEVFEDVQPLATSILDGYNVCIFAYGQTGSGKTFTMEGSPSDRGVNYRTLDELFSLVKERKGDYTYEVRVAVMEIYNETIIDLLSKDKAKLEVKMAGQVSIPGLTTVTVSSSQQVIDTLSRGYKNRSVGSNSINADSSRSHCIVSVYAEGINMITRQKVSGKLHLIDLAGSERLKRTETTGDRLKESLAINKSLSSLGDVISALAAKKSHVPYRNSKLTSLLQDSLGGNSKTLMFVNVSPTSESSPESVCSLQFASRVNKVELGKAEKNISSI